MSRVPFLCANVTRHFRSFDRLVYNPTLNGTLRHQDLDLALSQRAQAKVDKYREGYAAQGLRHAFLPAIVSTSERIHGESFRLLFNPTTGPPNLLARPPVLQLQQFRISDQVFHL